MSRKTIIAKIPREEVHTLIRDLPGILSGRKADKWGLRDCFYGVLAEYLYKQISIAYKAKANSLPDELGEMWEPLAQVTIKKRHQPKFARKYPLAVRDLINRVSDALYETLKPGTFDGFRYRPRRNQRFHVARGKLTIGSKLKYASHVHRRRPLWADHIDDWIDAGCTKAMDAVFNRLKEVLQ